jgi:hypothetical protein
MAQVDSENSTPMPAASTRRHFLSRAARVAGGGTVLALAIPLVLPAGTSAGSPDPIFAMITMHKKLQADWMRLNDQLDEAEFGDAAEGRGRRPTQLIRWRGYTIGDSEIDIRRETLLEAGQIEAATVEQEYLDAKARYQARYGPDLLGMSGTGFHRSAMTLSEASPQSSAMRNVWHTQSQPRQPASPL